VRLLYNSRNGNKPTLSASLLNSLANGYAATQCRSKSRNLRGFPRGLCGTAILRLNEVDDVSISRSLAGGVARMAGAENSAIIQDVISFAVAGGRYVSRTCAEDRVGAGGVAVYGRDFSAHRGAKSFGIAV